MKLYISGNKHVSLSNGDERERLREELDNEIDVVFAEGREETASDWEMLYNMAAAPVVFGSLIGYFLLLKIARKFIDSDAEMRSEVRDEFDVEVVKVDRSLHEMISASRKLWAVFSLASILPLLLVIIAGGGFYPLFFFGAITLALNATAFIAGTASSRNMGMVMNVSREAQQDDYDAAVLFVGGGHKSEMEDLFREYSPQIELVGTKKSG